MAAELVELEELYRTMLTGEELSSGGFRWFSYRSEHFALFHASGLLITWK